ncbi:MAG TPA: heme-binding protein [Steroidobacteraceae bacterium]|jgi:glc operon protein GlcG|nr:heme-binding protein [Steroidobacteraceae bacterium]
MTVIPQSNRQANMKSRIAQWGFATVAAVVFSATALAQKVPAQFLITGKAAEKIQDFTTINLATAERIADACVDAATAQHVQISILVLDKDGNDVYMDRMDGQSYLAIATAEMKARTALADREPSKVLMNRIIEDPAQELQSIQLGLFANSGGLPIVVDKQLIGAVGVGGSAPKVPVWSDEICGHKALIQVIGQAVPPLVQDLPRRRNPNPDKTPVPVPRFAATTTPKSSLPAQWVVSGAAAAAIYDGNQISLAAAKGIARVCRDWAASKGATMSLFIIDDAGELVHMERMDGQVHNNIRTALLKAQTALKTRQPTSIRDAQLKNDSSGFPRQIAMYQFFTNSGGLPIVVDGQMIGAIGVSGVASRGDENCAVEGLKATFGTDVTLPVYPAATGAP